MTDWMLSTVAAGALIALAARAAEAGVGGLGGPRRWVWAASMLLSLLLPLAGALLPFPALLPGLAGESVASLELLQRLGQTAGAAEGAAAGGPVAGAMERALAAGWALSSAGLLALLFWTGRRLRAQARRGPRLEVDGLPVVVSEAAGPAVVGLLRPAVVLPAWVLAADERERELVLRHEWEHVRAGDARLLGLATLALVVMPWSLPLWWQHRRLRLAVETDCDARVLAGGADARAYGAVLLRTAGRGSRLPLAAPSLVTSRTLLERRILAMTQKTPKHPVARALPLCALSLALVAGACEMYGSQPVTSPTEPTRPNVFVATEVPTADAALDSAAVVETVQMVDGQAVKVRVRRMGSAGGDSARFSVQQVEAVEAEAPALRVLAGSNGVPPLMFLDGREVKELDVAPATIEKVEVLKGATAVELYGERARGGVVRITTKKP